MPKYFVDTNYFLRFLIGDNSQQFKIAKELFTKAAEGKINAQTSVIVFFEIYWVLHSFYRQNKQKCLTHLKQILRMAFVGIENREILEEAVKLFEKTTLELEDCYNLKLAHLLGASQFATFDTKASKVFRA